MTDRCRNRDCRQGTRKTANMTAPMSPMAQNNRPTPDCRGNVREEHRHAYPNAVMQRLRELDFSITDTVLYLDAYPHCQKALDFYHELIRERDALLRSLSQQHHTPVTSFENASRDSWDWTMGPWPWEASANG